MKGLYPGLFPGGRSVTRIPFTQSKSACSKPVSASGPLCLHSCPLGLSAQSPHTAVLWTSLHSGPTQPSSGPLSSALPPLQPLLCSPAALQPCHRVVSRALGGALFIESTTMYCPQMCSELVNHSQVRILATGTLFIHTSSRSEATQGGRSVSPYESIVPSTVAIHRMHVEEGGGRE